MFFLIVEKEANFIQVKESLGLSVIILSESLFGCMCIRLDYVSDSFQNLRLRRES